MQGLIALCVGYVKILFRFGVTGILATSVSLLVLYVLADKVGIWYVYAATVAFLIGFCVSFLLQKFWTFRNTRTDIAGIQAIMYLIILAFNLGLNACLVYALVEWAHLSHLIAQAVSALLIAGESFFAYRFLVFRNDQPPSPVS